MRQLPSNVFVVAQNTANDGNHNFEWNILTSVYLLQQFTQENDLKLSLVAEG